MLSTSVIIITIIEFPQGPPMNLPVKTPAEVVQIDPESLEVANAYLSNPSIEEVSDMLGVSRDIVASTLSRREVKAYVDGVFLNTGFNNRFRMREALDALIQKKFEELQESDIGSNKDIAELLELSHKFTMSEYSKMIELEKLRSNNVKNQLNVQINDNGGSNYNNLLEKLLNAGNK